MSGAALPLALLGCLLAGPAWSQANPVFTRLGPDAVKYGADQDYPFGPKTGELLQYYMVGTTSHFDQMFPHHVIGRAPAASPLPRARNELALTYQHDGAEHTLADYLQRNPATSLLIARDGSILFEHYRYGRTDADRLLSYSMAKSVTGLLIGIAVHEGAIASIDQTAAEYVPQLAGTAYGKTTIRDLLRMASGVAFNESYDGTDDATKLRIMQYGPGGIPTARILGMFNTREAPPGTRFHYAGAESATLALVLTRAVKMPVAEYLSMRIWQKMGAEADATWGIDGSGVESGQCCLSAVARDWLRLGMLLANDGMAGGQPIIPQAWLLEATTVQAPFLAPGTATRLFGYGYQIWILPGARRQFALFGLHGQAILVDPATKTVLVHTAVRVPPNRDPGELELLSLWGALVAGR